MEAAERLKISAENLNSMLTTSLQKISETRKKIKKLKSVSILRKKRKKKEMKLEVPSMFRKSVKSIKSKVATGGTNIFKNILGFVSLLVLGTVINNIDTIKEEIDKAREKFTKSLKPFTDTIKSIYTGVSDFISSFGVDSDRDAETQKILDQNKRLEKIKTDFDKLGKKSNEVDSLYKDIQSGKYSAEGGFSIRESGMLSTGEEFTFNKSRKKPFVVKNPDGSTEKYSFEEFLNKYRTTDLNNILTKEASKNMYESRPFSEKLRESIPLYNRERMFGKNILDVDLLGTDDSLFSDTTTVVAVQRVIVDEGSMI